MVAELPERGVELQLAASHALHLLAEALEGLLQLVTELSLGLFGREVVSVVHVLVLAQVRRDFADLGVELQRERKQVSTAMGIQRVKSRLKNVLVPTLWVWFLPIVCWGLHYFYPSLIYLAIDRYSVLYQAPRNFY